MSRRTSTFEPCARRTASQILGLTYAETASVCDCAVGTALDALG
jgi:hypothetical protein